jgi:hypothetical protein
MTIDFNTLRKINVSENIEKKGNLSYLSWTYAVDTLLQNDPQATWQFGEPLVFNETMMVGCTVNAFGKVLEMQLPVMDNRNNAIRNPDARKISDAQMRCLTKCIACFGIGLYIYAGEDLPDDGVPVEPIDIYFYTKMFQSCKTIEELKVAYINAVKECKGDRNALQTLESTKDNVKADLESLAKESEGNNQ